MANFEGEKCLAHLDPDQPIGQLLLQFSSWRSILGILFLKNKFLFGTKN
jgi:hypothetical protein